MLKITITDGGAVVETGSMASRAGNLQPALKNIGEYMMRATEGRFNAQKDPDGRPWTPLSSSTLLGKKHSKILTEAGRLRGSVNYRVGPGSVTLSSALAYAAAHQYGFRGTVKVAAHMRRVKSRDRSVFTRRGAYKKTASGVGFVRGHDRRMNIPARPFLGVGAADAEEIKRILTDHIEGSRGR